MGPAALVLFEGPGRAGSRKAALRGEIKCGLGRAVEEQSTFLPVGRPDDRQGRFPAGIRDAAQVVHGNNVEDQLVGGEVDGIEIPRLAIVIEEGAIGATRRIVHDEYVSPWLKDLLGHGVLAPYGVILA